MTGVDGGAGREPRLVSDQLTGPSVLALVGRLDGPSLWRVFQPFKALQQARYRAFWEHKNSVMLGEIAGAFEGFILPRISWPVSSRADAADWFRGVQRSGRFVVYDADDDIFNDYLTDRTIELGWSEGRDRLALASELAERIWCLKQCDGVTVSTQRLATVVRSLTDAPVLVVPNAIDVPWFRTALRRRTVEYPGPAIGWAGGRRPDRDVLVMAQAWGRIAARYPDVVFVVAGHFPDVILDAVPRERRLLLPWMPLERYPEVYAGLDVVCCSVADEAFNHSKSVIKAYEAAVAGACVVASPTLYRGLIEHGQNGYLAETVDEWEAALAALIERPAARSIMARRLLRSVERNHALADNTWRWPLAWQTIREHAHQRRRKVVVAT